MFNCHHHLHNNNNQSSCHVWTLIIYLRFIQNTHTYTYIIPTMYLHIPTMYLHIYEHTHIVYITQIRGWLVFHIHLFICYVDHTLLLLTYICVWDSFLLLHNMHCTYMNSTYLWEVNNQVFYAEQNTYDIRTASEIRFILPSTYICRQFDLSIIPSNCVLYNVPTMYTVHSSWCTYPS